MQIIGIDVAKATFDIALPLGEGKFRTRAKRANTASGWEELLAWRRKHAPGAAVGMEATGIYHEGLARYLVEAGVTVYVVNPARIKAYGASELLRTKTDHTDAKLIARFLQASQLDGRLVPYVPPTPSELKLRALVRRLDDLKQMRRMEPNRREGASEVVIAGIVAHVQTLGERIREIEEAIGGAVDTDPDLRARRDVRTRSHGIADAPSAHLLARLAALRQYGDVGQIAAHAGLNPAQRRSGKFEGKVRTSRAGDAALRAKLY